MMAERRGAAVGRVGAFAFGALCGGLVVVAGVIGWMEDLPERETPPATRPAPAPPERAAMPVETASDDADSLREELAAAEARMRELEGEREQLADRAMTDAILDVLADTIDRSTAERARERAESVLRGSQRRIDLKNNVWFGGLYDTITMLIALGRLGDTGVDKLIEASLDESRPFEERQAAIEALSFFPDVRALEILLHPPEPIVDFVQEGSMEFEEMLARSASWIGTDDLEPLMKDLYEAGEPGAAQGDNSSLLLMGVLAFIHDNARAQRMFRDRTLQRDHGAAMLEAAQWVGGEAARDFVEDVSRRHPDRTVRDQAAAILADW